MDHYRKNTVRILSFVLAFCVVFSFTSVTYNRYSNLEKVEAAGATALVSYILSALGVVNVLSNGQVSSASGSVVDSLEQLVADAMGSGIYIDSNGNYVFGNEFTQSVYEALSGSSNYDVRVLSNFTQSSDDIVNADYFSPALVSSIATMRSAYDNYLLCYEQYSRYGAINTYVTCYDLSNCVAILSTGNKSQFLNSSWNTYTVNYKYVSCSYTSSSGYSGGDALSSDSSNKIVNALMANGYSGFGNEFFLKAPLFNFSGSGTGNGHGFSFYSNRSLVVGSEIASAKRSVDQTDGIFFNNNSIPSISQTAIENNNWNNIYNNYVQNVAENYYSENPTEFDQNLLRKWMRQYSNNIIAAIQGGLEDVEGAITTSNNWLRMIYDKLSELNTSGGSGGGCSWSEDDIDYMLNKVNSIDLGQGNTTQELILIYGLLDDILDAVRERNAPTPDMLDWLDNLPDLEILDTLNKLDIVTSALEAVVPMCYLAALGAILGGLATDPEPIDIEIPFAFNSVNGINVDEAVSVDLTNFETVHTILIAAEVLAYICFLMIASFRLLHLLLDIFSGG